MKPYSSLLPILKRVRKDASPGLLRKHRIYCETGDLLDSAVLKLQKKDWTDSGIGQGAFFSIWIADPDLKKKRFNYNIHAFKMGLRKDYIIKPREFASSFRARFDDLREQWPNVRTDYGPQTLLQGWCTLDLTTFRQDVLDAIERFVTIHHIIDEMLEERKKC